MNARLRLRGSGTGIVVGLLVAATAIDAQVRKPTVPIDPVTGIIDALRTHRIVALAEGIHNNEPAHVFRLSVIRHPQFVNVVNDIVVEFGNARFQETMDGFINGDEVPPLQLRRIWQDTTQPNALWDVPIYEEFFRAVREVNLATRPDHRVRVLLADPPIDWDQIHNKDDLASVSRTLDRDAYPARLIQTEVIARNRRALLIYGDGHLARRDILQNFARSPFLVPQLEAAGTTVFTIFTELNTDFSKLQVGGSAWLKPSLAVLRGTMLGGVDAAAFGPEGPRFVSTGNGPDFARPLPKAEWRALPMEEQFDAFLYLGREMTMSQLPKSLCGDRDYMSMRVARMTWAGMERQIERLQQYCSQ